MSVPWSLLTLREGSRAVSLENRDRMPAALLAAAEHDVRSLLGTIRGGADALQVHLDGSPLEPVACAVARAGEQLSALLIELVVAAGQLLDGRPIDDTIDVGELLGDVAGQLGVLRVAMPTDEPLVVAGSRVAVRHVLMNLLDNSVCAGGAGAVSVKAGPYGPDEVEVEICNPVAVEPVRVPSHASFLHAGRGRGLRIVEAMAAATGMQHRFEVLDGTYVARVRIPRRLWHPSMQQPKRIAGEAGQVAVIHEVAWAASGEQSG